MRRLVWFLAVAAAAQSWQITSSESSASLRGLSAVSARVVWASGTKGTILRTTDAGVIWQNVSPPAVADLDFRDIEAMNERVAFAMSSGPARASRLYRTGDGGMTWTLLKANQDPDGFWDAIAMWDPTHGLLLGDPVDGKFTLLTTNDGLNWTPLDGPKAEKGEAAFAGSGTALIARGTREAWFVTGGAAGGRVFHTEDSGRTWSVSRTPLKPSGDGAGLFAVAFSGATGVAVGGDFTKPKETLSNIVMTGGRQWTVPPASPSGYRSAVVFVPDHTAWIATGTSGSDLSADGGRTWKPFDDGAFNALSVAPDGAVWAAGPTGRIAKLVF